MKLITTITLSLAVLFTSGLAQASVSDAMNTELDQIEAFIKANKSNYKVEEQFESATMVFLRDWPVEVQRSLYLKIWETSQPPLIIDPKDLGSYDRSLDIEYNYSATIIRSATVTVNDESTYLVIYSAWGGEWNRSTNFLEYYMLDAKGELLRMGTSR